MIVFNNMLDESFVTIEHESSFETLPVNSKKFENFLVKRYYEKKGTILGVETVKKVIRFAEMKAGFDSENRIEPWDVAAPSPIALHTCELFRACDAHEEPVATYIPSILRKRTIDSPSTYSKLI